MATLAEMLRQGADKLINLPSEAQRFVTNPQAFTQLLTGKNPLPRETGFAAGATGLPAQEMSVLDPNQAPYMQGYSQGEPIAYLGMATPFAAPAAVATAKALAPKAGMMAENYMVKQGMIQPLTAYHGTPHTIQGQFDINKVGTGEGAQAFGHGIYFAENPAVANEYARELGSKIDVNGKPLYQANKTIGSTGNTELDDYLVANLGDVKATRKQLLSDIKEIRPTNPSAAKEMQSTLADLRKANVAVQDTGNLYKVDIPDADIPNMLDWDKPLSKMTERESAIIEPLKQKLIASKNPYNPESFETIGQIIQSSRGSNPNLEKELAKAGFTGIRYLDEGSRLNASHWEVNYDGGQAFFKSPEKAKEFMATKKNATLVEPPKSTSNFVVFDPSNVKILEKNNKPVTRKELIQEQINKIE